jgi:hypothetical protein
LSSTKRRAEQRDQLRARVAELEDALTTYGDHVMGCFFDITEECDCGFLDRLAQGSKVSDAGESAQRSE